MKDKEPINCCTTRSIAIINSKATGVRSFPIRDAEAEATMVAHVIPIRLSARDIFVRCFAVLAMTPMTRPQSAFSRASAILVRSDPGRSARRSVSRLGPDS